MKTLFSVVLLLLLASVAWSDNLSDLKAIQANLQKANAFNVATVGSAAQPVMTALKSSSLALANLQSSLDSEMVLLNVSASTTIYGVTVDVDFTLYYQGAGLLVLLEFDASGDIASLYTALSGSSAPAVVADLTNSDLGFTLNTGTGFNVQQGIVVTAASTVLSSNPLMKTFQFFQPESTSVSVSAELIFPLFGASGPNELVVLETATFPLMAAPAFEVTSVQLTVCLSASGCNSAQVDVLALISANVSGTILPLSLEGTYSGQSGISLTGKLLSAWPTPLGLKWLSISSAVATLAMGPYGVVQQFSLNAYGQVSYSPVVVSLVITIGGADLSDILIEISGVPISSLDQAYTAMTGKTTTLFAGMSITGSATLVITTFDTGSYQQGITLNVSASVGSGASGALRNAIGIFEKGSSAREYDLVVYIPGLGAQSGSAATVTLIELDPISLSSSVTLEGYQVEASLSTSDVVITLSSVMEVDDKNEPGGALMWKLTADYDGSAEEANFDGVLQSAWVQPFGMKWMTVTTATMSITIGGGGMSGDNIEFNGQASLTFSSKPCGVVAQLTGADFTQFLFALTNIPLKGDTPSAMFVAVTGIPSAPVESDQLQIASAFASIAITNANLGGYPSGLSFEADVNVVSSPSGGANAVYSAVNSVSAAPENLMFTLKLLVPVFSPTPADISFSLLEVGTFAVTKSLSCSTYHLDVQVSANTRIDVGGTFAAALPQQPSPVVFALDGTVVVGESLALSGNLESEWDHPFGTEWLNISSASVDVVLVVPATLQTFDLSGDGIILVDGKHDTGVDLVFDIDNDFAEVKMSATITNLWTTWDIVRTVAGSGANQQVEEFVFDADLDLSLTIDSTFGVTFSSSGTFTGALEQQLMAHCYWLDKALINGTFQVAMSLPIFTSTPLDVQFDFKVITTGYPLSNHIYLHEAGMNIAVGEVLAFGASADFTVTSRKNPPLTFSAAGEFSTDQGITLQGAMDGVWINAFGYNGFNLSNVVFEIGVSPAAAATLFISDLGAGATWAFGDTEVELVANFAEPDFADIYMMGQVDVTKSNAPTVLDVATEFNRLSASSQVPTSELPADWSLKEAGFYLATSTGNFGPYSYVEGFGVSCAFVLLDMTVGLDINCTESGDLPTCNFAFDVGLDKDVFEQMLKNALGISTDQFDVLSLDAVSIDAWSQQNVSVSNDPIFNLQATYLGKPKMVNVNIKQWMFAQSFGQFFDQWLKQVFN